MGKKVEKIPFSFTETEFKVLNNLINVDPRMIIYPDRFECWNYNAGSRQGLYEFDEPYEFEPFGIFDMKVFLSAIKVNKFGYKLEEWAEKRFVSIINMDADGNVTKRKVKYQTTPTSVIKPVKTYKKAFTKAPKILDFTLSGEDYKYIKRMSAILKAERVYFSSQDGNVIVELGSKKKTTTTNPQSLEISGDAVVTNDLPEGISIFVEYVDVHLLDDYDHQIQIALAGDIEKTLQGQTRWANKNIKNLEYFYGCRKYVEK